MYLSFSGATKITSVSSLSNIVASSITFNTANYACFPRSNNWIHKKVFITTENHNVIIYCTKY